MKNAQAQSEQHAAEVLLVEAVRVDEVDLEPTPEEIETFLRVDFVAAEDDRSEPGEDTVAAYVAMNRDNSENAFSETTERRLESRRATLLQELLRRHEDADE